MLKQITAGALITRKGETTHLAEEGIGPQCIGTGCKDELSVIPKLQLLFLVRAENRCIGRDQICYTLMNISQVSSSPEC